MFIMNVCKYIFICIIIFIIIGIVVKKKRLIILGVVILILLELSAVAFFGYTLYKMDEEEKSRKIGRYADIKSNFITETFDNMNYNLI